MGEYADAYVDAMIDGWGWGTLHRSRTTPYNKRCQICGEKDLRWKKTETGSWRLFKAGKFHECESDLHTDRLKDGA